MRLLRRLAIAGLLLLGACQKNGGDQKPEPQGTGFDFYVLSLSWSPAYCRAKGRGADPRQCNAARPFGFIVHGLWPQFESGYPQFCSTQKLNRDLVRSVLDLTPSEGLVRHEWDKHGTCSGLAPEDYFAALRSAFRTIKIPPQFNNPRQPATLSASAVETAFIRANPGMSRDGIAVSCERDRFDEVRICLSKTLKLRACPQVDSLGCKRDRVIIDPVR